MKATYRWGAVRGAAWIALLPVVAAAHVLAPGRPLTGALNQRILWELGVPRLLTALLAGAALGVAGYVLQAVLRNPMAAPEFTGVNPGAVLGVLAALTLGVVPADSAVGALLAAVVGGALGGAAFASMRDTANLVVYGLLGSALLAGFTTMLLAYQPGRFGNALRWLIGSVEGRVWEHLSVAWWWIAGWIALAWLSSAVLAVLSPGDDHAASLGLPPVAGRAVALTVAIALTAGAASLAGAIAFVGLVVPHAVRRLRGGVLTAALLGGLTLAGADALAQFAGRALAGTQRLGVPTGVVTALAGAAVLVYIARKEPA
ncbi:FecCD family ABC transporter permease [Nonomuraea recticatena]|uniref:Iron ABC transporter permease n=1 Tax=Nonomuraea recticatena TaxID=46178 RepID=A0ABN3RP06_9ACTN